MYYRKHCQQCTFAVPSVVHEPANTIIPNAAAAKRSFLTLMAPSQVRLRRR